MGNVIGEPLKDYVIRQIEARQKLYGSGAGPKLEPRTDAQINLISSPTAWIKLASAVRITDSQRLTEIGVDSSLTNLLLAKKFILSSGLSELSNNNLINRGGFDPLNPNLNSSYTYGQYGYVPMPGLISADIKTLNRGSIKKATVKLIAQDSQQFQIIDLLYLRLGYTVLLEWGNSLYTKTGTDKNILRETILEKDFYTNKDFRKVIDKIEAERNIHEGNYDGFLAKVSNFSWSVNNDGSYDIELTLISLGDVVESLKTNISPDINTTRFIKSTQVTSTLPPNVAPQASTSTDTEAETPTETNQASSIIHSMLYIWKWIDEVNQGQTPGYGYNINIFQNGTAVQYGYNLNNKPKTTTGNTLNIGQKTYVFLYQGNISIYWDREYTQTPSLPTKNDLIASSTSMPISEFGVTFTPANSVLGGIGPFRDGISRTWTGGYFTLYRYRTEQVQIPSTLDTDDYRLNLFEEKIWQWAKSEFGENKGFIADGNGNANIGGNILTGAWYNANATPPGNEELKSDGDVRNTAIFEYASKNIYTGLYSSVNNTQYPIKINKDWKVNDGSDTNSDGYVEARIFNLQGLANRNKDTILDFYIQEVSGSSQTFTIDNPLKDALPTDAVKIFTKVPSYYLRFKFLLKYIQKNILPNIKSGTSKNPIFDIQFEDDDIMFSIENQISLDPRICIVRNNNFLGEQVFEGGCDCFRAVDNPSLLGSTKVDKDFAGYIMNIYLNFDFIIESLTGDEKGDVNMFDFIRNICTGINKALGGINNLEPVLDEDTNTLRIIDTTPIPGTVRGTNPTSYTLLLTGYQKNSTGKNYISNFIRKVDLKTAITPEFATMITVGATAGGYVKGTDATAFSKWNQGLVDLYKEEVEPGNEATANNVSSGPSASGSDEAILNWQEKMVNASSYDERFGYAISTDDTGNAGRELKDSIIQGNVSIGTEYYKYYVAKESNTGNGGGGSIGFIPFKLSFTMDGLSGVKIYNKLNVDTSFLPQAYGNNLDLIVTGVSHRLQNQDWETSIETTVIPTSNPSKSSRRFTGGVVSTGSPTPPSTTPSTGGRKPTRGNKATGDLYIWSKGPSNTTPENTNNYLANILKGRVSGDPIPKPVTPLKFKPGFPQNQTNPKSGKVVLVTKYVTTSQTPAEDENFFKAILTQLGAPSTPGNLIWLKAWRQAEGAKATYNPFNSTQPKSGSTNFNTYKVKNYLTVNDGVTATVSTINNGLYSNIIKAFKKGIPDKATAYKLAQILQKRNPTQQEIDNLINSF
jgi:hypothetical protein